MFCNEKKAKGTAVALGYFDGIHMGHQAVLNKALERAEEMDLIPVVMLFDIHPRKLLTGKVPPMLLSEERKRMLLKGMGFEVFDFDFRKAMNYSPEEFEKKILLGQLNAKVVVCGYDYHYGKGGKGNPETLKNRLAAEGLEVYSLSPVYLDGEAVSSTKIRQLMQEKSGTGIDSRPTIVALFIDFGWRQCRQVLCRSSRPGWWLRFLCTASQNRRILPLSGNSGRCRHHRWWERLRWACRSADPGHSGAAWIPGKAASYPPPHS